MRRRAVLLVLSVLVAAVGTGLIAVYVKNADNRALAGQRVVSVLVANKKIDKGTPASTLLESKDGVIGQKSVPVGSVPQDVLPGNADQSRLAALGRAQIDISPGQPISANLFSPVSGAAATTKENKDNTEILVPLSGPQSAAGLISVGGETTVLAVDKAASGKSWVLIPTALVLSINGQDGDTASTTTKSRSTTEGADSTVGLSVSIKDAQRIAWAQDHELTLYLVGQTDRAGDAPPVTARDMP